MLNCQIVPSSGRRAVPAYRPLLLPLSIACGLASFNLEAAESGSPTLDTVRVTTRSDARKAA